MTLFCSDIDGTLLNPERTISRRTIRAIRALVAAGHTFALCSSRMPASMEKLEALYDGGGVPLIAYNGGLVLDSQREVVLDVPLDPDVTSLVYEECETLGVHGSFYCGDNWYAWADDFWSQRETNNTGVSPNDMTAREYSDGGLMATEKPHKIMCMGEAALIDQIARSLASVGSAVTYRSKDTYLEIANASCSKGDGLRVIAAELGVDLSDCFFFGDNYNDLPAFEVVGHSVAVANSKDEVLRAAEVVTERHHDDGVAVFIEEWLHLHG